MTERRSFFASDSNRQEIEAQAKDSSATTRWLASIKLAEIHELWAAELLWVLKVDDDENTRSAAVNALKTFPPEILGKLGPSDSIQVEFTVLGDEVDYESWKFGILSPFSTETAGEYATAIESLVEHEGPITGGRIQRLIQLAAKPSGGGKISQVKFRALLDGLVKENILTRADEFFDSEDTDLWILHLPARPAIWVRPRNERLLTEIPVNEARQVLLNDQRVQRRPDNRDVAFACLQRHYEIMQNELFLVGEALEGQWRNLFRN